MCVWHCPQITRAFLDLAWVSPGTGVGGLRLWRRGLIAGSGAGTLSAVETLISQRYDTPLLPLRHDPYPKPDLLLADLLPYSWALVDSAPADTVNGALLRGVLRVGTFEPEYAPLNSMHVQATAAVAADATAVLAGKQQFSAVSDVSTAPGSGGSPTLEVSFFHTVYADSPLSTLVSLQMPLQVYFDRIEEISPHVSVVLYDASGHSWRSVNPGCAMAEASNVLDGLAAVGQGSTWRVVVGQCPRFTAEFVAASPKQDTVWVYVGIIALSTVMAMCISALALYMSERGARLRIATTKHDESTRAHKWVVGYGKVFVFTVHAHLSRRPVSFHPL